jgi:hypothetical protein
MYTTTGGSIRRKRHVGIPHGIIHRPSPSSRLMKYPELMDGVIRSEYLVAVSNRSDDEKMRIQSSNIKEYYPSVPAQTTIGC